MSTETTFLGLQAAALSAAGPEGAFISDALFAPALRQAELAEAINAARAATPRLGTKATLIDRFPEAIAAIKVATNHTAKVAAEQVAESARRNLIAGGHNRTGDLLGAIHVERKGHAEYAVVAGNRDFFYAHFLENGTEHSPAYPFLMPAAEEVRGELNGMGRQFLGGALEFVGTR